MKEMYNKVFDNVMGITETHKEILMLNQGMNMHIGGMEAMSPEEIANYFTDDLNLYVSPWQIEEVIEEGMEMIETPVPEINEEYKNVFVAQPVNDRLIAEAERFIKAGCKAVYSSSAFVNIPNRTQFLDMRFVIKDHAGIENLNLIIKSDNADNWLARIICEKELDFVLSHREGLLLGATLHWDSIDDLIEKEQSGQNPKTVIEKEYGYLDFISLPRIQSLFTCAEKDSLESAEVLKARQNQRKEMARKAAQIFEELGIKLIYSINVKNLDPEDVYEYIYLGMDTAVKAMYETPYRIAQTIEDIDPRDEALKPVYAQ